jgi:methylglutaconyl-CoA hydratase
MTTPLIDLQRPSRHVARVFLNRPEVRNAFNDAVIAELGAAFAGFADDPDLRCVVLGGHGKAFCAGADLAWMRAMGGYSWDENRADAQRLADMLWLMWSCPVPVIGRVHGDCYAGGVGLAAVCDIVVAGDAAGFCLSEARLGLVHEVVPSAPGDVALDAAVDRLVEAVVANGPHAVRACKQLVRDLAGQPIDHRLREDTARRIADIRSSAEGREGVSSFLERRAPAWKP